MQDVGTAAGTGAGAGGTRTPARTADTPVEEATPAAAADPGATLPTAAAAPRRATRTAAQATPERLLGTTEATSGAATSGTPRGTSQEGKARGERRRLHGGEAEATGLPETESFGMFQIAAAGEQLMVSAIGVCTYFLKCARLRSSAGRPQRPCHHQLITVPPTQIYSFALRPAVCKQFEASGFCFLLPCTDDRQPIRHFPIYNSDNR